MYDMDAVCGACNGTGVGPNRSPCHVCCRQKRDITTVLFCVLAGVAMVVIVVSLVHLVALPDGLTSKILRKLLGA
jgi:hypothetical protein